MTDSRAGGGGASIVLRHALVGAFTAYGLFVLVFGPRDAGMAPTTWAMVAIAFTLALMFVVDRCFLVNFMIATYVGTTFFVLPWIDRLFIRLEPEQAVYLEGFRLYFDAPSAVRVYSFVLLCLLGWLTGLLVAPRRARPVRATVPRLFRALDHQVFERGPGFWFVLTVVIALSTVYAVRGGWGAASAGSDGQPALLLGLLNPAVVVNVCLCTFLSACLARRGRSHAALLLPLVPTVGLSTFMGSRGALYASILLALFYLVAVTGSSVRIRLRVVALMGVGFAAAVSVGALANVARPLWRINAGAGAIAQQLGDEVISGRLIERAPFSVAVLAVRLADVFAPFYVLNDRFVLEPWDYVNPAQTMMRTVNAMVPGEPFPGIIGMNQFFNWIYMGTIVVYNSEMWSFFAMPYLYFGFLGAPLAFAAAACVLRMWVYDAVIVRMRRSPSLAVFVIGILWGIIVNGTVERVVSVDIWTFLLVIASFVAMTHIGRMLVGWLAMAPFVRPTYVSR